MHTQTASRTEKVSLFFSFLPPIHSIRAARKRKPGEALESMGTTNTSSAVTVTAFPEDVGVDEKMLDASDALTRTRGKNIRISVLRFNTIFARSYGRDTSYVKSGRTASVGTS